MRRAGHLPKTLYSNQLNQNIKISQSDKDHKLSASSTLFQGARPTSFNEPKPTEFDKYLQAEMSKLDKQSSNDPKSTGAMFITKVD